MTEKSVLSKVVDDQKPDFLYTNNSALKPIQEELELEDGSKRKMPAEETKIGDMVKPMKYISQFEEMGEEKDLDEKIKAVHQKIFNDDDLSGTKKTKLGKLLQNMRKKKLMKIKKKKEQGEDITTEVTKEITSLKSNTKSHFDDSSKKKSSGESGESVNSTEEHKHIEQESSQADKSITFADKNNDDMRNSKISIFSHNYPLETQEIRESFNRKIIIIEIKLKII